MIILRFKGSNTLAARSELTQICTLVGCNENYLLSKSLFLPICLVLFFFKSLKLFNESL